MQIHGTTGQPGKKSDGSLTPFRAGNLGEQIVQELHGRYYETTYRGNAYYAYSSAASAVAPTTANVGLQLWNPPNSGINVVVFKVNAQIIVTSASALAIGLYGGVLQPNAPTSQTAISTSGSTIFGNQKSPIALPTKAGTFVKTPTLIFPFMHVTAAIAVTGEDNAGYMDFEGSVVCTPGNYLAICPVAGSTGTSALNSAILWEEVPI